MDPTLIIAIATCGAAVVTAWMAVETRRMANAAGHTVDFESMPILGIRDIRVEVTPCNEVKIDETKTAPTAISGVRVGIELYNAGRVPIRYGVKAIQVTFSGRTIDSPHFLSRSARILPGSSVIFWHPTLPLDPPISSFPAKGRVHCEFEYGRDKSPSTETLKETFEYSLAGAPIGSPCSWLTVDEPDN
jgi:hypothetical protein